MAVKELSGKQWKSGITWLLATMEKVDAKIHELGCAAMLHAEKHGDVSRMVQLVQAMGKTTRVVGFLVWVEKYSPIRMKRDGTEARIGKKKGTNDLVVPFNLEVAEARPFWTLLEAEEKTAKPLSIEALIGLISGFGKKIDKVQAGESETYELKGDPVILHNAVNAAIKTLAIYNEKPKTVTITLPAELQIDEPVEMTGTNG